MKKIKIISVSIISSLLILVGMVYATDYYRVNHWWGSLNIAEHDYCAKVTNNNSVNDYFIPTRTSTEWSSFRSHLPNWTSLDYCNPAFYNVYWDNDLHWSIRKPEDRSASKPDCWTLWAYYIDVESPYGLTWSWPYGSMTDALNVTSIVHNWHTIYRNDDAYHWRYWACASSSNQSRVWRGIKYH